eukprot:TRINITY_DN5543_c0_g2_i2.p4 TRINITY_DN5543_c0_g2~~TRINITY_DN5543_c0_g2_i2.p4  ORF type:complete len:143 (+),score=10.57 TRINITY_DN5543_c0_g2_i2:294-722(+)
MISNRQVSPRTKVSLQMRRCVGFGIVALLKKLRLKNYFCCIHNFLLHQDFGRPVIFQKSLVLRIVLQLFACLLHVGAKQQLNYSDGCNNESSSQFPPCCTEYIVKQGEEICDIAESNNLDCDLLKDFNDLEDVEEDDILQIC